jgi:hypothetical protein
MSEGLRTVAVSQIGDHENIYEEMVWLPQVRVMEDVLQLAADPLSISRTDTTSLASCITRLIQTSFSVFPVFGFRRPGGTLKRLKSICMPVLWSFRPFSR